MPETYAESRAALIDAFTPKAKKFAELIRNRHLQSWSQNRRNIKRYHPQKMDFGYIPDDFPIHHAEFTTHEIPGDNEGIKFWFNPWCFIAFYDIRQRGGAEVKAHREPAVLLRKTTKGAQRQEASNDTDEPQPMTRTFKQEKGSGGSTNIGAKASSSFRQLIAAGGEAASFKSETEITVAVEASVDTGNWNSEVLVNETTWGPQEVPPRTRYIISRLVEVGRYQQKVIIDGELDYSVYVLSRGDFDVPFDSRDELAAVLSGVGNTGKPGNGHFQDWARAYSRWPLGGDTNYWIDQIAGPVVARVIDFDEADQAMDESFSIHSEAIA